VSTYIDADAFVRWEKGEFDLIGWLEARPDESVRFPATVWQQLNFGVFAWQPERSRKRGEFLETIGAVADVAEFGHAHAVRAAQLSAEMDTAQIGFADFQIAATALVDDAQLLTFNQQHFGRVAGLKLAKI
jgi:predicted nucleic acid-binding protein